MHSELDRVERLDLRAHQEVQRDVKSLPETDQYGRGGQHLARLVLADRLCGHLRTHRVRELPHRKSCPLPGEPESLSKHRLPLFC